MAIKENAQKLFYENGIYVDFDDTEENLELDSLTFISLITALEDMYDVEIPLDMLQYEKWKNISLIEKNIKTLVDKFVL